MCDATVLCPEPLVPFRLRVLKFRPRQYLWSPFSSFGAFFTSYGPQHNDLKRCIRRLRLELRYTVGRSVVGSIDGRSLGPSLLRFSRSFVSKMPRIRFSYILAALRRFTLVTFPCDCHNDSFPSFSNIGSRLYLTLCNSIF